MSSWEAPAPFVEPTPRRIRVRLGDELVADSTRAQLLVRYFDEERLPTYYLPQEDVRPGALVDETIGPDGQRTWAVRAGSKRAEGAAWTHEDPTSTMAALAGHVTFSWRQLEWYEEDERVVLHARDPYKRVDTLRSSRRVQVLVGGEPAGVPVVRTKSSRDLAAGQRAPVAHSPCPTRRGARRCERRSRCRRSCARRRAVVDPGGSAGRSVDA